MQTEIIWINRSEAICLAIAPRPRGSDWLADEIHAWKLAGVDKVVSLLTPDEVLSLELSDESQLCHALGMEFGEFPIVDRETPTSMNRFTAFVRQLADEMKQGKRIAVHCRQGIGRAALVAICVLIATGVERDAAIERVTEARGRPVPETPGQVRWIADFAKSITSATPQSVP